MARGKLRGRGGGWDEEQYNAYKLLPIPLFDC